MKTTTLIQTLNEFSKEELIKAIVNCPKDMQARVYNECFDLPKTGV